MSGLDWLIVSAVVFSVLLAAARGLFYEIFSLAGMVLGYLAAAHEYSRAASWYTQYVKSAWMADVAGFLTIFIAVVLLAGMAGHIARIGFKEAGLGWADRLLGASFGLVRGGLMIAVLLLALTSFVPGSSQRLAKSKIAPYLLVVGRGAVALAPEQLQTKFRHGANAMRELRVPAQPQSELRGSAKAAPAGDNTGK